MALQVETIGNYNVRKLPNGMYSVSLNNGNLGAFMCDEEGVKKLREKYHPSGDRFVASSSNEGMESPKMTYEDAKKIYLFGTGKWGFDNIRTLQEAEQVILEHEANMVKNWFKSLFSWS